jgi:hypothetical protein
MGRPDADLWQAAIEEELSALKAKQVYTKATLPAHTTALPSKLVLDIKRDEQGSVSKYKPRLVAKGFKQVTGRDYDEVFAPTAQHVTLRVLLALAQGSKVPATCAGTPVQLYRLGTLPVPYLLYRLWGRPAAYFPKIH